MGTTVVCALLTDGHLIVAHVGDSRLYLGDGDDLVQLTQRRLVGRDRPRQPTDGNSGSHATRHVLTNVLGVRPDTQVHLLERELSGDETLLLCSDGLTWFGASRHAAGDRGVGSGSAGARAVARSAPRSSTAAATTSPRWWSVAPAIEYGDAPLTIARDAPSPERIGRYQVIERIGRGAMGVVYRARDEAMGRDVALKVLTADLEDDPDIRTRFHREAEAAASLSHPNIITIFDVGEDGDRFFIVMELLRGATLKDFLKQSDAAPLARKLDLMIQLCAGLGAAHNASIYHRDIKPGNIFVRADGILKILDFGVARLASSSMTAAGFIVGTPDYMSPEQARGADIDGRSDIFSLGGVFYFMLTGRKPFPATDLPDAVPPDSERRPRHLARRTKRRPSWRR